VASVFGQPQQPGVHLAATVMRAVRRQRSDPFWRHWGFWYTVSVAVSVALVGIGIGFALDGLAATQAPGFFVVIDKLPGGAYTHGWIMVSLGVGQFAGLSTFSHTGGRRAWLLIRATMGGAIAYSAWCVYAFAWGAIKIHHYSGSFWWYVALMIIAFACVRFPPTTTQRPGEGERDAS
jgi:hypothetical protein